MNELIRGKGTLKPIPSDPEMEKMDKNTAPYKYKLKRLQCITCAEQATQMMCYDVDGAVLVEDIVMLVCPNYLINRRQEYRFLHIRPFPLLSVDILTRLVLYHPYTVLILQNLQESKQHVSLC